MEKYSQAQHDEIVRLVNQVIETEGIDPSGDVASVSRDLLSAQRDAPVLFGNATTNALREGQNLTPDDHQADAMSLRYDDLTFDDTSERESQWKILMQTLQVAQQVRKIIDNNYAEKHLHLLAREIQIIKSILGMYEFNKTLETIESRTREEELHFFAGSVKRRLDLKRRQGIIITGFTDDPGDTTYKNQNKIHYRETDGFNLEAREERKHLELKYNADTTHADFPKLEVLAAAGHCEDHEQAYIFVRDQADDLPSYELRVRKVTSAHDGETYLGTIKTDDGADRQTIEFDLTEELYQAFLANQEKGFQTIKKRRYFVKQGQPGTDQPDIILDFAEIGGQTDHGVEIRFPGAKPDGYQPPAWTTTPRGSEYNWRKIAKAGRFPGAEN